MDTTLIRLLNGNRTHIHAVIENDSRRIIGWRVADSFQPGITAQLLLDAWQGSVTSRECVVAFFDRNANPPLRRLGSLSAL